MWKPLAAAVLAAFVLSAAASADPLPAGWTHAEINYTDASRTPHTLVLDRGRVTLISSASLTLRELDGSSVQIALSPSTQVVVVGRPAQITDIRRGSGAMTQRIDGGPAVLVRVTRLGRLR